MPLRPTQCLTPTPTPKLSRALTAGLLTGLTAWVLTACGGGADAGGFAPDPEGGTAGLAGSWQQGGCVLAQGSTSARQVLVFTARPGDRERADIALEWLVYAGSNCTGTAQRLQAGEFGNLRVTRTQSSGETTATWATWTINDGEVWSTVWHWRGRTLCTRNGLPGRPDDPERALPTAREVAEFFSRMPANTPSCYTRL